MKLLSFATCVALIGFISCTNMQNTTKYPKSINHVVVIGIDGLNGEGLEIAKSPNMDAMIADGAYCDRARVVFPVLSAANWSAMLTGVGPEISGVYSNGWRNDTAHQHRPPCVNEHNFFPTIFSVVRANKPESEIGAVYDWKGISHLFERELVSTDIQVSPERKTAEAAADYIRNKKPTFTFIQLDGVDGCGHRHGWMSEGYYKGITAADSLVATITNAVKDAGIMDNTLIYIIGDHGGFGKSHGTYHRQEIATPVILYGASVKKGYKINSPVYLIDLAPTVAFALGMEPFSAWRGKPIKEAFEGFNAPVDAVKVTQIPKEEL